MGEINNKKLASISLLNLPAFPDALLDLLEACGQTFPDSEALEAVVCRDIALCTRLLDLAAAHWPAARRITRIADLIDEIGVDALRTLAMSAAVNSVFTSEADARADPEARTAERLALRRESLERACLARRLAQRIAYPAPDEAYLSGLLQGLGELALATQLPEYRALPRARDSGSAQAANEPAAAESLGGGDEYAAAGAALGHWIVRNMHLDSMLADALLYCGEPFQRLRAVHPLLKIARVANALARPGLSASERQAAAELLGLREQELADAAEAAAADVERQIGVATTPESDAALATPELQRHADAHQQLVEQVRRQGLLSNTRPKFSNGGGLNGVLSAVRKALHILFGLRRCSFFMYDHVRDKLQGMPLGGDQVTLGEFVLPCSPGVSVLCDAFLHGNVTTTARTQERPFIVDQLLARLVGADALLCLPFAAHERKLGVAVVGVGGSTGALLDAQRGLLQSFAQQASFAIARQLQPKAERPGSDTLQISQTLQRIAQDVANPLAIIKNYVKILRMKLTQEDSAQPSLTVIDEEIDRITDIIRSADKPFADAVPESGPSDLNATIFEIVREEGAGWADQRGVAVRTDLRHSIPPLAFDRLALKQVLLNLLRNAAEATPKGGEIVVATRRDYVSEDGKLCVEIIVKDNGPGIPRHILDTLFRPVKSTKGNGHAGLGLHIVRNLVMQMGGVIQCHSTPARGTLFQILLPQSPSRAPTAA